MRILLVGSRKITDASKVLLDLLPPAHHVDKMYLQYEDSKAYKQLENQITIKQYNYVIIFNSNMEWKGIVGDKDLLMQYEFDEFLAFMESTQENRTKLPSNQRYIVLVQISVESTDEIMKTMKLLKKFTNNMQ